MGRAGWWGAALGLGLALAALAGPRVRLTLTDGRVVEGELTSAEGGAWTIEAGGQRLTFSAAEVARVDSLDAAPRGPVDLSRFDRWRARPGDAWTVKNEADGMAAVLLPLAFRYEHRDRVEAVDAEGRPTRWERTYEAFEDKRLDAPLALRGRPITIAREGSGFTFAGKGGWPLPEFLRERLDEELNESLPYSPHAWRPPGPVAPGAEWPLAAEAVGFLLGKSTLADFQLEGALAGLEGVAEREGTPWAAVRFLIRGKLGAAETELRMVVRAPLDGSSCAREEEATMRAGAQTRVDWKIVRRPGPP